MDTNNQMTVEEASKILGKTAENLSDEEIQEQLVKYNFWQNPCLMITKDQFLTVGH